MGFFCLFVLMRVCQHFIMGGGEAHEASPVPKGTLMVSGCFGGTYHFVQWCSYWSCSCSFKGNHVEHAGLKLVIVISQSLCTGFTGICHQAWVSDLVFHRETYSDFPVCPIFIFLTVYICVMHRECFLLCLPNHFSVLILEELEIFPPSLNSADLGVMEVTVPWGIDHVLCCCRYLCGTVIFVVGILDFKFKK